MQYNKFWENKELVAKNTIHKKECLYGIDCMVEILESFDDIYGEESPQKTYTEPTPMKLLFTGITGNNMLTLSHLLSSTEQENLYIQRFEKEALPRNTRIYLYQGVNDTYRLLEVRDTIKNEGTYVVLQELVPQLTIVEEPNKAFGRNLVD